MTDLYVDINAHHVYRQIVMVAFQHALQIYVVTKDYLHGEDNVHLIVADDDQLDPSSWIANNIKAGDLCVTGSRHIAYRCIARGARALSPSGGVWGAGRAHDAACPETASSRYFSARLAASIAAVRGGRQGEERQRDRPTAAA